MLNSFLYLDVVVVMFGSKIYLKMGKNNGVNLHRNQTFIQKPTFSKMVIFHAHGERKK